MTKLFLGAFATSALLATTAAQADSDFVTAADHYCQEVMFGAISADDSLTRNDKAPSVPFGSVSYQGTVKGQPVTVIMGTKFGNMMCDVHFPQASADDYAAANATYHDQFGVDGTVYDNPQSTTGYRGEIWGDKDTVDGGTVENLTTGDDLELSTLFVQYTKKPFKQTADRAGLIISMDARN